VTGRRFEVDRNAVKTKVMRILRQQSPIQIMVDQRQPENADCFISLVSVITDDARYTGCNRRNGPDFGRVFLMLNYTGKPQNTYC
jgi:hypothetical protein